MEIVISHTMGGHSYGEFFVRLLGSKGQSEELKFSRYELILKSFFRIPRRCNRIHLFVVNRYLQLLYGKSLRDVVTTFSIYLMEFKWAQIVVLSPLLADLSLYTCEVEFTQ
jgi:hypothetical protein